MNNTTVLNAIIKYLLETKRFDAQLYRCSPDVMVLTLILLIRFLYFFYLLLGIYAYIFLPYDCKFFRLKCKYQGRKK